MSYQGLATKFPVNRPLTTEDHKYQLKQNERFDVEPYADLAVVKLNSSYMEVVDKFFHEKGLITGFVGLMVVGVLGLLSWVWLEAIRNPAPDLFFEWNATAAMLLFLGFGCWVISKESFAYTHYPIRLNRKTRTAYVFRLDGTVMEVPWDELFFTLDYDQIISGRLWENRAHVLDADGETVRETFVLGVSSTGDADGLLKLRSHWEFYRRYMDEGPQAVTEAVKFCMPVDGKREPFRSGYEVIFSHYQAMKGAIPALVLLWPLLWSFAWLSVLGRWVAMRTSKIPQWPAKVEAANVVDPSDPYLKDARINPPDLR